MNALIARLLACTLFLAVPLTTLAQAPKPGPDMILVRATKATPDQVVADIQSYAEQKKWQFMGASKAKGGEITMVKVCIPEVGKLLWPLGLQISALLPCGNFGVYQNKGQTHISMLHPQFMQALYPRPEVEKAVAVATPLLTEMLDTLAKE